MHFRLGILSGSLLNTIPSASFAYGTAHVQVYKKTRVILRDSENFEDNLRVRRVRHEEYIARE